jgi:hypothetical protein
MFLRTSSGQHPILKIEQHPLERGQASEYNGIKFSWCKMEIENLQTSTKVTTPQESQRTLGECTSCQGI